MSKFLKKNVFAVFTVLAGFFVASILFTTVAHAATPCSTVSSGKGLLSIEPVWSVLKNTDCGAGQQIKEVWSQIIKYVNFLIMALLIFVAFAQILQINVNTYGVKKILPSLILAIVAANFSFLFCRLLVDLANVVMSLFIAGPQGDMIHKNFIGDWADPVHFSLQTASLGTILWFMVAQVFVIIGAVFTLILAYLFFIRVWLIYFLVALAPLAFMATVLPQTKSVFNQWMSNFAKWVFLPVVSIFWIWLGNQWLNYLDQQKADYVMSYVFAGICYYLAITTPFKMGGAVMTAWGKFGQGAFKNKATNWAMGKAKSKWIDPMIQDWKNRSLIWWFNQAQGSQSKYSTLNPLGAIARRGLRTKEFRKQRADWVPTAEEGALRWALGGKPIEEHYDPKTGKIRFKYKFWSDKGRRRYQELQDSVRSDQGEADYIRKQLDLDWKLNSEKGKLAVGRSVAYGMRVAGVENWLKSLELDSRAMAFGEDDYDENGKPRNWFLSNTSFGIVAGDRHWKRQKDFFVTSQQKMARSTELISTKIENDRIKFDYQPAATLTMLKEEINALKNNSESQTEGTQAYEDLKESIRRWKDAIEEIKSDETLFKNGKFTSNAITLKSMLTDANGAFIGDDHEKAQSLTKLWGYEHAPDDLRDLFLSRLRKATSIIAKEEVTSEAGKRIAVESARRSLEKFAPEIAQIFTGEVSVWTNRHKDAWAAFKNSLVGANDENAPIIYSMYAEFAKKAVDGAKTPEGKQNALKMLANSQQKSLTSSLQQQEILGKILTQEAEKIEGLNDGDLAKKTDEERNQIMSRVRGTDAFRKAVQARLQAKAADITRQNSEDLKKVLKVKFNKNGQIQVFADTSDVELSKEMLSNMMMQSSNFNIRERTNAEGQQRQSSVAGFTAAAPTSEEAITYYEKMNYAKEKAKRRKREEEARAAFFEDYEE